MAAGNDDEGRNLVVWVDGWQLECCGDPFAIGSSVTWTLAEVDTDRLAPLFPPSMGVVVDRVEEHHGRLPLDAPTTSGTVLGIRCVQLRYATSPDDTRSRVPVPGSARLTSLTRARGAELRWEGLVGYLVELRMQARASEVSADHADGDANVAAPLDVIEELGDGPGDAPIT